MEIKKPTIGIEIISPKDASALLSNLLEGQRVPRKTHIAKLANDIANGDFILSSDAVVILKDKLANGQHRLAAVVEANKSAPFLVMRTDDEEIFKIIDAGIKRSIADVVHLPNGKEITAIATLILAYDCGDMISTGFGPKGREITRTQVIEYIPSQSHRDLQGFNCH